MGNYPKLVGIRTWGHYSVLPRHTMVWCRFGDAAFKKRAEDVKPGDRVLERGTKIALSLRDIKDALLEDELTYRTAHRQLHVETPEGEKPKLQLFLEEVTSAAHPSDASQKEKIEFIGKRLEKVSTAFGRWFPDETKKLIRSESAIGSWLNGKTVLPSDLRVLRVLRELDRAKFDELFGSPQELKPREAPDAVKHPTAWAHGHWSTVHKTLRRWAEGNQLDPEAAETQEFELPEHEKEKDEKKKVSPELRAAREVVYQRLIKHIAETVDSEHKFTRVKEAALLTPREEREHGSTGPVISRGVISASRQPIESLGIPETSARAIFREFSAARELVSTLLQHERIPELGHVETPSGGWGEPLADLLKFTESEKNRGKEIPLVLFIKGAPQVHRLSPQRAHEIAQGLQRKIESGKIDEQNGLSPGTFKTIFERMEECRKKDPIYDLYIEHGMRAMPAQLEKIHARLGKDALKDELKEIKRMGERLLEYGVQPGSLSSPRVLNISTAEQLESYQKLHTEKMHRLGVKHFGFEPRLTRTEMEGYLSNIGIENEDIKKVMRQYGHHNFVD